MTIEPGATLTLDLRALPATTTTRTFTLANVDELSGTFTTHDVQGIGQNGITGARLVYNYDTDDLVLQVFSTPAAGTGFTFVTQTNNVVSDGGAIVTTPTTTTPVIPTPPTTPPKPATSLTQAELKALLPRGTASTTLRYRGVTGADLPDGTRCNSAALIDKLNTDRERFHALSVKRQAACLRELRQRRVDEVKPDATHTYPVGLFDFTIETTPGGTEEVTLTLDQRYDTSAWVYRKYKDGTYTTIPNITYGTRRIDGITVTTVTYSVTDNGPLDLDPTLGIIRDPAGPAIPTAPPPTTPDPVTPPVSEPPVTEPPRSSGGGGGTATRTNRSTPLARLTKNLSYIQPQFNDRTEVEALQRALNYFENANLTVTGTFDAPTFTAVKTFQTKYRRQILDIWNLTEATGYVGITTRLKLNSLIGGQTTTCPAFTEYNGGLSGIRQSPEIGRTQAILQELGMYRGPINNTWDTATNQALITFQETFREVMLDPWNITAGTGYKYKTTNLFLNYFVGCETGTVELEGVGRWGI
jgi:hypothetical protein